MNEPMPKTLTSQVRQFRAQYRIGAPGTKALCRGMERRSLVEAEEDIRRWRVLFREEFEMEIVVVTEATFAV